jgi:hypothetical protein
MVKVSFEKLDDFTKAVTRENILDVYFHLDLKMNPNVVNGNLISRMAVIYRLATAIPPMKETDLVLRHFSCQEFVTSMELPPLRTPESDKVLNETYNQAEALFIKELQEKAQGAKLTKGIIEG